MKYLEIILKYKYSNLFRLGILPLSGAKFYQTRKYVLHQTNSRNKYYALFDEILKGIVA